MMGDNDSHKSKRDADYDARQEAAGIDWVVWTQAAGAAARISSTDSKDESGAMASA